MKLKPLLVRLLLLYYSISCYLLWCPAQLGPYGGSSPNSKQSCPLERSLADFSPNSHQLCKESVILCCLILMIAIKTSKEVVKAG